MDLHKIPFFVQESDELKNAAEYIESLESATRTFKRSLKYRNGDRFHGRTEDEEDEEEDAAIDEIIQSVFTENQNRTLNQQNDTLSKKGKLARGDVRGIFSEMTNPVRASFNGPMPSANQRARDNVDWNQARKSHVLMTPAADYSDEDVQLRKPIMRLRRQNDYQENRVIASAPQMQQSRHKSLSNKLTGLPRTPSHRDSDIGKNAQGKFNSDKNGNGRFNQEMNFQGINNKETNNSGVKNSFGVNNFVVNGYGTNGSDVSTTRIEHLGRNDIDLLKVFAETEIRTIFTENGNIKFNKMTTKRRSKDSGIFGVSLESLLSKDSKKLPTIRAPIFITLLISKLEGHVHEEGILRVPGNQVRMKETIQILEHCDNPLPHLQSILAHDLAGLMKHFFRTLPQPLFTLKWLDAFCKALTIQDSSIKLYAFQTLVCLLPDVHRATLQLLTELLIKMSTSHSNRMSLEAVSMVISPSLFAQPTPNSPPSSFSSEVELLGQFNAVILFILRNSSVMWNVPALFLKQVREVGWKTAVRTKKFKKKTPENSLEKVYVHSLHPDHLQQSIDIHQASTVAEALAAFNSRGSQRFAETVCLFENGGTIDQRLLLPSEHLSSIIQDNPHLRLSFSVQTPHSLITSWPPELYH